MPPAALCDANGKPLLSWRVAILPYIEAGYLYDQFHLNEPWDSPHNMKLLPEMPQVYKLPGHAAPQLGYTYFRVFVSKDRNQNGHHAAFDPPQPGSIGPRLPGDFVDGESDTILVAEASEAVPWTKPDELIYDPNGPLPALGGHFKNGFLVGLADGSIRHVSNNVSQRTLRNAIERDDGNILGPDW